MATPRNASASPAMAQWFACKRAHPEALLFFQMGDFFELFFADAEAAAPVLGLALTKRGEHDGKPIPLCGVPLHAADAYLLRLIRRGFRVAIAEQMERAQDRSGRAPIRREVVRLVTPGTLTEDALLEAGRANRLLALALLAPVLGAAWLDISTGGFETQELPTSDLHALLGRLDPAEILAPADVALASCTTVCRSPTARRNWAKPRRSAGAAAARPRWRGEQRTQQWAGLAGPDRRSAGAATERRAGRPESGIARPLPTDLVAVPYCASFSCMRGMWSHHDHHKGTFVPLDIPGDTPLTSNEEPWRTARDIIADQGFNAEFYVIRLAARFADEGNIEDAATLGEVLDAITVIRELKGIRPPGTRH